MKKYISYIGLFITLLLGCDASDKSEGKTQQNQTSEAVEADEVNEFWQGLQRLQGKAFEGKLVEGPANNDFDGKKLVMHVLYSDDEQILIPFNVGENLSRTWIFTKQNNRIELKHDHRKENGNPDEITMYGGTSTNNGIASMQVFPADQQTYELIPAAFSNVWWVSISESKFVYNLNRIGSDTFFSVEFDLTNEISKPAPSWGWEDFHKK